MAGNLKNKHTMLKWEEIDHDLGFYVRRTKVFGGWLVTTTSDVYTVRNDGSGGIYNEAGYEWRTSITFVPDPKHEWIIE